MHSAFQSRVHTETKSSLPSRKSPEYVTRTDCCHRLWQMMCLTFPLGKKKISYLALELCLQLCTNFVVETVLLLVCCRRLSTQEGHSLRLLTNRLLDTSLC